MQKHDMSFRVFQTDRVGAFSVHALPACSKKSRCCGFSEVVLPDLNISQPLAMVEGFDCRCPKELSREYVAFDNRPSFPRSVLFIDR